MAALNNVSLHTPANLIISGQVLHGLHDHARQGGCGHDPQPDSRPDGGRSRGWWLLLQVWQNFKFQNCILVL